jgi:hypothetical protein
MGSGPELLADTFFSAATLADVAGDAAEKAELMRGVDVDRQRVEREQLGVMEGEDAFYDDDLFGVDFVEGAGARVGLEVVDGAVDRLSGGKRTDVVEDEFGFERVGVIEVLFVTAIKRKTGQVAVVEVEREERGVELGGELGGEGGFARAGTAGYGEDDGGSKSSCHRSDAAILPFAAEFVRLRRQ